MVAENFSNLQSQILNALGPEGLKTFEQIQEETKLSDMTLQRELDNLISKGTIIYDSIKCLYDWESPLEGNPIILEGNLLLPLTVIRMPDKGEMYVSRGKWYKLPINFQLRRIIWNVKLENKTESTLVDMIKSSIIKGKKTKIVHLAEYNHLRNKAVPYCQDFKMNLDSIGEERTSVTLIFRIPLRKNKADTIYIEHTGFTIKTEILTKELCDELNPDKKPKEWTNITLDRILKFGDFMFSQNEIPIKIKEGEYIEYIKIFNQRGNQMLLETWTMGITGTKKKQNSETMSAVECYDYVRDVFKGLPKQLLLNAGFNYEETE